MSLSSLSNVNTFDSPMRESPPYSAPHSAAQPTPLSPPTLSAAAVSSNSDSGTLYLVYIPETCLFFFGDKLERRTALIFRKADEELAKDLKIEAADQKTLASRFGLFTLYPRTKNLQKPGTTRPDLLKLFPEVFTNLQKNPVDLITRAFSLSVNTKEKHQMSSANFKLEILASSEQENILQILQSNPTFQAPPGPSINAPSISSTTTAAASALMAPNSAAAGTDSPTNFPARSLMGDSSSIGKPSFGNFCTTPHRSRRSASRSPNLSTIPQNSSNLLNVPISSKRASPKHHLPPTPASDCHTPKLTPSNSFDSLDVIAAVPVRDTPNPENISPTTASVASTHLPNVPNSYVANSYSTPPYPATTIALASPSSITYASTHPSAIGVPLSDTPTATIPPLDAEMATAASPIQNPVADPNPSSADTIPQRDASLSAPPVLVTTPRDQTAPSKPNDPPKDANPDNKQSDKKGNAGSANACCVIL